jgi:hypothetical protein
MEWLDIEIKLFITAEGPFNSYIINRYLKSRPLTPALAVLNNLPPTAKLPLFINVTAPPLPINATAPSINTLKIQLTEAKATTNYSRDLATLAKIYTEESKYSRKDNNFNCKLIIFNNLYNRVNIPQEVKIKGFLIILHSIALDFYYKNKATYVTFNSIYNAIRNHFKGLEYKRRVLIKWNTITLKTVMIKNKGKFTEDCLQLLLNNLHHL